MHKTAFGNSYDVIKNKAPTYTYYSKNPNTAEHTKGSHLKQTYENFPLSFRADAGLFSSAQEMAQWIVALQNNQLIRREYHQENVEADRA